MRARIVHVDIDAFFASVEQLRNPHLRGRPVIVGSGVIASCSYEARKYGLHAGMSIRKAQRLCPEVVVLEGRCAIYRCFGEAVFEVCRRTAPQVETHLDEAYCDFSGTEALYGPPVEIGRSLKEKIRAETGLAATVGIGTNRMIAGMAGDAGKPDGLIAVEEGREADFVRDLPVEELPGVGHARLEVFRKLNIATIGEMRKLEKESLEALFGASGAALYERCRGRDGAVISQREVPRTISRETAFHEDTADGREIEGMLYYLLERAAGSMRALGLRCRTVAVYFRHSDDGGDGASRSLPSATEVDGELFTLAASLLGGLYTRRANLHSIGVQLSNFSLGNASQRGLFDGKDVEKRAEVCRCLDRLRHRFGHSAVMVGKTLDALGKLRRDRYGYVLRTPSLTK
ncbi:MAG: DNA polymerase IV [Planctomycetota bacterium]